MGRNRLRSSDIVPGALVRAFNGRHKDDGAVFQVRRVTGADRVSMIVVGGPGARGKTARRTFPLAELLARFERA